MTNIDRRNFLALSGRMAGVAVIAPSLTGLIAYSGAAAAFDANGVNPYRGHAANAAGYGDLRVYSDLPEISLPEGFRAVKLSQTGQMMSDNIACGNAFDGMGAFPAGGNRVRLVRNHEHANSRTDPNLRVLTPVNAYDEFAPGGTTTLEVEVHPDGRAELKKEFVSLSGTYVNCAGGPTPWGSWISCEETVAGTAAGWARNHGYNFEVPSSANGPVQPVPLREMGRFMHEAVAVDPATGIVYQTEDRNPSGFYRYIPKVPGQLAMGGTLQAMITSNKPKLDSRTGQRVGDILEVEWADIPNPDSDEPRISSGFVFDQALELGATQFARLEGCFHADGGIYFDATTGGDARAGQIWKYTPTATSKGELVLIYESPSFAVLNMPDNICVSPRGGIIICEDGSGTCFVRGIGRDGGIFDFMRNNLNASEWAGACFSPDGRTLFVNMQGSTNLASTTWSATYAIWGPWEAGAF